ncbi:MAG: hypothetical protein KAF41_04810 [Flavobacterium sp.]|nr:hypothetical protein [Flavobacterium sp.]PZO33531.1 MAG: hypothetical protein DCE86_04425 [Flavobacteriaceae bacterium]
MKYNPTKILLWLTPIFFVIIILLFYCHWKNLNQNIAEIKKQNKDYYEKIVEKKNYGPFQIDYKRLNKKQVIINPVEIEKINNHIKVLTEEVQKETNRAESIIDKDLDRLNLYMAIGIGFMTLLGIFAPILINILSVQDLREKQSQIEEDFKKIKEKDIDQAIENANKAISDSNLAIEKTKNLDAVSQKIDEVEKKAKKNLPDLCNLILQNAIFRFFNVSSFVLTEAHRKGDYREFIGILESIKNGFERCNDEKEHNIDNNHSFKFIIKDFIIHLNSERFKVHPVFSEREDYNVFDALIKELSKLKNSKEEDKEVNYRSVIDKIQEVINQFNNKNTENQPAAIVN